MDWTMTFTLHLFDIIAFISAIFLLGVIAGHKFLPHPIDEDKERLIDTLFKENRMLKLKGK